MNNNIENRQRKTTPRRADSEPLRSNPTNCMLPVSEKKHSSGEEYVWEDELSECQIRGWNAVSADGLQGERSCKGSVLLIDTGMGCDIYTHVHAQEGL